jgi:hypothetical protein
MSKTIKIQIISDYQDYKKGQIVELDEKAAVNLLTNGKALKIHRKSGADKTEITENKTEENSEENTKEKGNKKTK